MQYGRGGRGLYLDRKVVRGKVYFYIRANLTDRNEDGSRTYKKKTIGYLGTDLIITHEEALAFCWKHKVDEVNLEDLRKINGLVVLKEGESKEAARHAITVGFMQGPPVQSEYRLLDSLTRIYGSALGSNLHDALVDRLEENYIGWRYPFTSPNDLRNNAELHGGDVCLQAINQLKPGRLTDDQRKSTIGCVRTVFKELLCGKGQ